MPPTVSIAPRAYNVQTEVFAGPLELLLSLIEKRKLLINEISLAKVADDFIAFVKSHPEFPVGETAHFILVASTLVLIKSKSLLPHLELAPEEEESIEELELRLKQYNKIRELSGHIKSAFGKRVLYAPEGLPERPQVFAPSKSTSAEALTDGIFRVIDKLPKAQERVPQAVVRKVITLEEMIDRLQRRMKQMARTSFQHFSKEHGEGRENRVNVVVSFLAMLELVKQGMLRVEQERRFSDIMMESEELDVPSYM